MEEKIKIPFLAGVKHKKMIYFSALYTNGLYRYDCQTKQIVCIMSFEGEKIVNCLHRKAVIYGDDIWFMPWEAERIAKYSIKDNVISYYEVKNKNMNLLYFDAMQSKERIIFVPYTNRVPIAVIDAKQDLIEFDNILDCEKIKKIAGLGKYEGGWLIALTTGEIFYNSKEGYKEDQNRNEKNEIKYLSSVNSEDYLWMCPFEEENVIAVNKREKKVKHICNIGDQKYSYGITLKNRIVMFPTEYTRDFLIIDRNNCNVQFKPVDIKCAGNDYLEMIEMGNDNEETYCIATNQGYVLEYDLNWDLISSYRIEINYQEYRTITEPVINKKMIVDRDKVEENYYFGLDQFLKVIKE